MKLYKSDKSKMQLLNASDVSMNFEAFSLYPSAMYDMNSEYRKAESARMFPREEEEKIVDQFNAQSF